MLRYKSDMDGLSILQSRVGHLPTAPGVYRMLAEDGRVLYVGKAKNLKARVTQYTQVERMGGRIHKMVFETRDLVVVETRTEVEALLLEANLIKSLKPHYNIIFRDDATYVSVVITADDTPQIRAHRGPKRAGDTYFGPYPSAGAVYQTLDVMERAFRLRTCNAGTFNHRTRPCLKYDIKRCSGPCVGKITPADYAHTVRLAKRFLKGERGDVLAQLQADMAAKAAAMDYEGAAAIRDQIRALSATSSASTALTHALGDADVFALVREAGQVGVQAFYYRHGQHVGNHLFTPKHTDDADDAALMQSFLAMHYTARQVPTRLVVNVMPAESDMLVEALEHSAGRKVVLEHPQRGEKTLILRQAERNAQQALRRAGMDEKDWTAELAELQAMLGRDTPIERIECYDISNTQGRQAVASQVVGGPAGMMKGRYRKYAIKGKQTPDDYAMLREVFHRRLAKGNLPDVMLVDGGKGQLNVLLDVLGGEAHVALCSIAKGEERDKGLEVIWYASPRHCERSEAILDTSPTVMYDVVQLPVTYNSSLIFVLQQIRDEAHRFAITYHRGKRAKTMVGSALDAIPGIGPAKKKALLLHFGSVEAIRAAALEELLRVPGINTALAEVIIGSLRGAG